MFIKNRRFSAPRKWACLLLIGGTAWYGSLQADQFSTNPSQGFVTWVKQSLALNPELQAASTSIEMAERRLTGAGLPIYNPELEIEYERTDSDLVAAGISQTLDWYGKQQAREDYSSSELTVATARYHSVKERLAGELIGAVAVHEGNLALAELAERQISLLERFADLAIQRGRAGDLGEIEVELAQLAYIEGEIEAATTQEAVAESRESLMRLAGNVKTTAALSTLPSRLLPQSAPLDAYLEAHPLLQQLRAEEQTGVAGIRRADIERRTDPTIGIRGGRDDSETLIGLQVSIPLQLRNNQAADVEVARTESTLIMQQRALEERNVQAAMVSARSRFNTLARSWQLWQGKGRKSLDTRIKLLEKLWRVGELSTTDYLAQLKQSLDTESAGLALQRNLWKTWIDWLRASGQVMEWLGMNHQGDL